MATEASHIYKDVYMCTECAAQLQAYDGYRIMATEGVCSRCGAETYNGYPHQIVDDINGN